MRLWQTDELVCAAMLLMFVLWLGCQLSPHPVPGPETLDPIFIPAWGVR